MDSRSSRRPVPFESADFDSLASQMEVLPRLSPNRLQRWYKARLGGALAVSRKDKVFFDFGAFEKLTEPQRLAVAAHELAHIREGDYSYTRSRIVVPTLVVAAVVFMISLWLVYSRTPRYIVESDPDGLVIVPLIPSALAFWLFGMFFRLLQGSWRRKAELRCDVLAATYCDGNALIEALRYQETLLTPKQKRSLRRRIASRLQPYPSQQEREEAIREVMGGKENADNSTT
jgi:Zn-dependent protease with chaperone function